LHHLVVDGVSWRILLDEVSQRLQQPAAPAPAPTAPFARWARHLAAQAASGAFEADRAYWHQQQQYVVPPLPRDQATGPNTVAASATVTVQLPAAATTTLQQHTSAAYGAELV